MTALQTTERFKALREKTKQQFNATTWSPRQGETLLGEIVGSQTASGAFGPQKQMTQ
jgi:hypothetical protein